MTGHETIVSILHRSRPLRNPGGDHNRKGNQGILYHAPGEVMLASADNDRGSCGLLPDVQPYCRQILFKDCGSSRKDYHLEDISAPRVDTDRVYVLPGNCLENDSRCSGGVYRVILFRLGADAYFRGLQVYQKTQVAPPGTRRITMSPVLFP